MWEDFLRTGVESALLFNSATLLQHIQDERPAAASDGGSQPMTASLLPGDARRPETDVLSVSAVEGECEASAVFSSPRPPPPSADLTVQ